jgi:GH35 family endo-1,4-beta-xylanase
VHNPASAATGVTPGWGGTQIAGPPRHWQEKGMACQTAEAVKNPGTRHNRSLSVNTLSDGTIHSKSAISRLSRRRFLNVIGAAAGSVAAGHTRVDAEQVAAESWLDRAREGIATHRQSELVVRVLGADGKPLSSVEIQVRQLRHDFLWGANLFGWSRSDAPDLETDYRRRFAGIFNYATLGFYWHDYESEQGQPRHARIDPVIDWCRDHRILAKGHPLVWANIADPAWLPAGAAEIRAASLGRVRDIVGRFRGRIDAWDVINEPSLLLWANTRLGGWAQSVGTYSFVTQHLRVARSANPDARLLVNEVLSDYPVLPLLETLCADRERLIDAAGLQSHMHLGAWPLGKMWELCDRFGGLGVPLHFTEFTILSGSRDDIGGWTASTTESEQQQAEQVSHRYLLLFGHPAVAAVTWWDLSDRAAWKSAPAGLLRADMSPKPAYDRLHDLIRNQWWTNTRGRSSADGRFACRAFHGDHRVSIRWPNGEETHSEVSCGKDRLNLIELASPVHSR